MLIFLPIFLLSLWSLIFQNSIHGGMWSVCCDVICNNFLKPGVVKYKKMFDLVLESWHRTPELLEVHEWQECLLYSWKVPLLITPELKQMRCLSLKLWTAPEWSWSLEWSWDQRVGTLASTPNSREGCMVLKTELLKTWTVRFEELPVWLVNLLEDVMPRRASELCTLPLTLS